MDHLTAYGMLLPSLVLLSIFVIWPLFTTISKSFTDWNFYNSNPVGFLNYWRAFRNPTFRKSFVNIGIYLLYSLPLNIILPFLFAHCVRSLRGTYSATIKTMLYVPSVIGGVISSVIFLFVLDYQGGLINNLLRTLGMQRINFFADSNMAKWAIVLTGFWGGFGYNTLYNLAGLNNIPDSYYEAASLDGANALQKLLFVTIPSMKNIFLLSIVNCVKGTLMMMELPMLMTDGGPNNGTMTPVLYIYKQYNDAAQSMGYTLACAMIMMVIASVFTGITFFLFNAEKSQE